MADSLKVGTVGEFQSGTMQKALVQGREILLARVGDDYYAAANRCPHLGGDLSQGRLEGTVVTCPRHGSQFDLRDGRVIRWTRWSGVASAVARLVKSPRPITTYPVKVAGDDILVEI